MNWIPPGDGFVCLIGLIFLFSRVRSLERRLSKLEGPEDKAIPANPLKQFVAGIKQGTDDQMKR